MLIDLQPAIVQTILQKGGMPSEELELMADYTTAVFLNFLPQFNNICRLDPNELNAYNLAMSSDTFIEQFKLLKQISELWKKILPDL